MSDRDHNKDPGGAGAVGLAAIFAAFFRLGATSFGGGTAAWLYRAIVRRRGWIDDRAFLTEAGISRVMPGSAGVNLTVLVGQRLRGARGAVLAVLGLLSGPFFIVIAIASGFARLAGNPVVHAFLDGVAAAAIGLTLAAGLEVAPRRRGESGQIVIAAATVVMVGVLRWPMLPVVLCLAPISIGAALVQRRGV